jgi:hypothetical protein
VWDHQGEALTVRDLMQALLAAHVPLDVPVLVGARKPDGAVTVDGPYEVEVAQAGLVIWMTFRDGSPSQAGVTFEL